LAEPIKAAIITLDDGMFKPVVLIQNHLDNFNFKATFYIICNSVDKENSMNLNNIQTLEEEGMKLVLILLIIKDLANYKKN
jgi:peptidoglycan/xylan/chitin deacetylase (PgdA/CDA1 family)